MLYYNSNQNKHFIMENIAMIEENVKKILQEIPDTVQLEAAAKTRTAEEVQQAVDAGVHIIGENYFQEAEAVISEIGKPVPFHFIGHLQRNKVKKAIDIFDMIETVDSPRLAREINKRCGRKNMRMNILIEVNSGREPQKYGIIPEEVEGFVQNISSYENLRIMGLMTMGPFTGDPEDARPYFVETRKLFETLKTKDIPNVEMKYLSMGMTNSYKIALDEGANIIRIGTKIFGERE